MLDNPSSISANEFMASPLPWVTSSVFTTTPIRYDFDKISMNISIKNHGPGELAVGFTRNGVTGSNRFVVMPNTQFDADVRIKELHLVALATTTSGSIYVGLTGIDRKHMGVLTGSIWNGVG